MKTNENQWKPTEYYENQWNQIRSMETNENLRTWKKTKETQWKKMKTI